MKTNYCIPKEPVRTLLVIIGLVCFLAVLPNMSTAPASSVSTARLPGPSGSVLAGESALGSNAIVKPGLAASPMAAMLTATKTDQLQTDVNMNGKADPGDTLMYTVTITNSGAMDATNVMFTDMIDANTTLVGGSVATSPIAANDTYNTIGNVNIQVSAAQGLLVNDLNPNGPSSQLTITAFDSASANGGTVAVNTADGSFTYNPPAGFTGSDTFTYTLGNGTGKTDTGTVTITVSGLIWFVNSGAGVNGDGRLASPFNILTGAGSADAVDGANDVIFLYTSATNYTGGITLNNGEKIIGQGASQSILTITGFTAPSGTNLLPATNNATDPMITTVGTTAITLGQNNGLHGFTVGDTGAAGTDIAGTNFGTLTVRDVTVKGTGRALNLATGTMAAGSTFDLIETTGGDSNEGARFNAVAGSFTATTTNIVNPTGTGIDVQGSTVAGGGFNFGNTTVNKGSTAGTGVNLNSNTGTTSFSSLTVTTSNGTGVSATSGGTVNVSGGSINATGGPALLSNPTTLGMTFTSVTSTNSSGTGISLTSASGSLTIGTTTTTNPSGIGISVNTSSATLNFGNTTSTQSGGAGVSLTTNTGTITFGSLNITPDANQRGLLATENTMTITSTSGAVTTTSATAVEITRSSGTTPLAVSLTSVSANGGANGIVLTRTSGSFIVNGDGSNTSVGGNSTGGTISNMTGADGATTGIGVYLETVTNVTLRRMTINGVNQNFGIRGISVTGFTLEYSTVSGTNGTSTALDEGSVNFDNLVGSAAITSCLIEGGLEDNLNVVNTSGTLNRLVISGSTFGFNNTTQGNNNILISSQNAGTVLNFTLKSSLIKGARADWLSAINNSGSTMDAVVGGPNVADGNAFDNLGANAHPGAAAGGNRLVTTSVGSQTVDIRNNTLKGSKGEAIFVRGTATGALTGTVNARVRNNTIGVQGTANSGSSESSGIFITGDGGSDMTVAVTDNTVYQYNNHGIRLDFGDEINDGSVYNASVTGNTVSNPGTNDTDFNGFHLNNGTVGATDNFTTCLQLSGNTLTGSGSGAFSPNNQEFRLRQRQSTTVRLPGYGGLSSDDTQVVSFVRGQNTVSAGQGAASNSVPTGGGFVGGAACSAPSVVLSRQLEIATAQSGAPQEVESHTSESLRAAPGEAPKDDNVEELSEQELGWMVQAGLERWRQLGISAEDMARLGAVSFEIEDLPKGEVARAESTRIRIDTTAAGYGWYFDPVPTEDSEFEVPVPGRELQTTELSPAHGKMDLLSVVMRELGSVYLQGNGRIPKKLQTNLQPLMEPTLSPAVRRLPLDQLRTTLSPVGSIKPSSNESLIAQSSATAQPEASQRSDRAVASRVESPTAKVPIDARFAVFNPTAVASFESMPKPAMMKIDNRASASSHRANRARRVAAFNPSMAPDVSVGPFTLPAGKSVTVMFNVTINTPVTPAGTTQVCNQGTVTADGPISVLTDDPDAGGAADPTCTTLAQADLEITAKNDSPDTEVPAGDNITYTINFKNNGPDTANNVKVSDPLPANTTLVSVTTPMGWTRTDSVMAGGTGTIMFEKATVANAETASFTIVVQVGAGTPAATVITNTASTTSDTPDGTQANNSKTATTTVTAVADLSITKTDGVTTVIPGMPATYTITVSNGGPNTVTGATVADTFPAALTGVTFTSSAMGGATGNTASGSGNINDTVTMPSGSSITYVATGTVNPSATGSLSNTATVTVPAGVTDPNLADNSATDTDTLTPEADLAVTKSDSPDPVVAGNNITYTINFTNNGPSDAQTVTVTDAVPANTTFVSATAPGGWSASTPAVGGTGNVVFSKATVAAGETAVFTIVVKVGADTAAGTIITNTASAATATTDPTPGNGSSTATTTVQTQADLAVTKGDSPDPVVAGNNITYTIDFVNNGASDAQTVTVTDAVPANTTFVSATAPGGWSTSTPAVGGTGNVVFSKATVAAGEMASFQIVVKVNADTANGSTITNTATAASATTDPATSNDSATATTTVSAQADLSVSKSDSPDPVVAGNNITYTINFTNNGPSDAQTVTVTDAVPANTTFVSASIMTGSGWSTSAPAVGGTGNVVFSKATVAAGETASFQIVVKVNSSAANASTITNTATAASATADSTPGDNSSTSTTTVQTQADLAVTKSDSPDPVIPGNNITYTINFTNNGPSDAQMVTVTDAVPANTTFVSATAPAGWTTSAPAVGGTGNVVFSKATVAGGETATFQIVVNVNAGTPNNTIITNTATASTTTTDPTPGNNSAPTTTTVVSEADLAVTKSDSPDPACVMGNITYTISFTNNGPGPGLNTMVTDAVPANTTFVSAAAPGGWSTSSPAAGGTGNVVFSKASVGMGETATFQIVVKVDAGMLSGATITNTVSAASSIIDPVPGNNSATSTTTVDPIAPVISCPANVTAVVSGGSTVTYPAPVATDNCSAPGVVCTPPSGSVFPLGATTVTCTATDAAGNTASCSFTVTTFDTCLQDDSSASRVLLWNSQTGDYVFCLSGAKISGRGTVANKGNIFTLTHNALDRRLSAQVDKAFARGTASLQMPPGQTILSMIDRDIRNNACACSLP